MRHRGFGAFLMPVRTIRQIHTKENEYKTMLLSREMLVSLCAKEVKLEMFVMKDSHSRIRNTTKPAIRTPTLLREDVPIRRRI